jgi:predicted Zn-dependent peptidase
MSIEAPHITLKPHVQGNPRIKRWTLPNGLQAAHLQSAGQVAHIGVLLRAGTRDEKTGSEGIAHFLEHMFFKGTSKRKAYHINSRLDEVGGELNAYTTKENIFLYATCLLEHLPRAADLISDMLQNSSFPLREMEKEKDVVRDEIRTCKDDPADELMEHLDELLLGDHPLARPILGSDDSVAAMKREQLLDFYNHHVSAQNAILCLVANISTLKAEKLAAKFFGEWKSGNTPERVLKFPSTSVFHKKVHKPGLSNAHLAMGSLAYGIKDTKRLPFFLLNNVLGGPAMNSRLNLNIREKYGLAYALESSYQTYSETGVWSLYLATDAKQVDRAAGLVMRELKKLRETKLGTLQLHKAKSQIKGQLALSNESSGSLLHVIARSIQIFDDVEPLESIFAKIDAINSYALCDLANEVFSPDSVSRLVFSPNE